MIPKQQILIKCPICESKNIKDLKLDETYYIRPFKSTMITKLGFCNNCSFLFNLNPLDNKSMKKYYEKNFQLRSTDLDLVEEHVHSKQAQFIDVQFPLKNKKILEIGPNTGKLLNHLKILYHCDTYFDELNFEAKKILENIQSHKPKKSINKKKFDVIIMRHILEHVVNPIQYLKNIKSNLSKDGVLFIEVPDFTFLDKNNDTLLFEHVNYFSQLTLSHVLNEAGYIVISQSFSITKNYATCSDRVLRVLARSNPPELKKGIPHAISQHQNLRVTKINKIIEKLVLSEEKNPKIGFYGASWWTERVLLNTNLKNISNIKIFDKDHKKQGTTYHGLDVISPSEISKHKPSLIFILSSFEPQIKRDLKLLEYSGKAIGWSDLLKMT